VKIAVYTIALNEEKHVKRWFESAKDADLLLIADTGSTDKTRFNAKSLGVVVHEISVVPWRFDVARNASLALIPEDFDICIQLDMDEILPLGWRKKVEEAFSAGNNWPIYKHVTSRNPDGSPKTYQHYFKIHPRKGFIWKYPIHEVLVAQPGITFKRELIDLEVDHLQDHSKSRKSYLDLLEMAVKEEPGDWRMRHYLNREYWYNKDWNKVLSSAYEAMEITNGWDVEKASTCMWASEASHHLNLKKLSIEWAERATSEAPNFYEAWHWRAHIAHLHGDWESCRVFAFKRLELSRQDHHLVKPEVWEWWGYDLMALSSHKTGNNSSAVKYGKVAHSAAPNIERLRLNLGFYLSGYEKETALSLVTDRKDTENALDERFSKQKVKRLPLAVVFDEAYIYPFSIFLYSARYHSDEEITLYIGLTSDNLNLESQRLIEILGANLNIQIKWITLNFEKEFTREFIHVSKIAAARFCLASEINEPFIYTDVDVLMLADWEDLYGYTNLNDRHFVQVVRQKDKKWIDNMILKNKNSEFAENQAFLRNYDEYFNSGLLIIDPIAWKKNNFDALWKKLYKEDYEKLGFQIFDQDILNYMLVDKTSELPEAFNQMVTYVDSSHLRHSGSLPDFKGQPNRPRILHFLGNAKPWTYSTQTRVNFYSGRASNFGKDFRESFNSSFWIAEYFKFESLFWSWVDSSDNRIKEALLNVHGKIVFKDY